MYIISLIISNIAIVKPLSDDRLYRSIRLENGIEVMLISDFNSPKAAASMSVGVGSFQQDKDLLGLAHFCEHMLFLVRIIIINSK